MTTNASPSALTGIQIADFSHFVAGPIASLILADMGAAVIKIEKIDGGDDLRRIGTPIEPGESAAFIWANRNKRSIALDLTTPIGREIAREIVASSDVLLENFSVGVMARFGLDYASLVASHPRLIYCAISAYGRDGSFADRFGFDPIAQAESGFMALNGEPGGVGLRTGPSVMDTSTGIMASNAILGALYARERTGHGQYVECALFDQAVMMSGFQAMNYLVSGREPARIGNQHRDVVPVGVFETKDKPMFVACANDRTWQRLANTVLNRPDLAESADYATIPVRARYQQQLIQELASIFRTATREHWLARMRDAAVPAGAINSVPEAFSSPEMAARGLVSHLPHPTAGTVPNIASPLRMSGTPLIDPVAAPTLGQHTDEVLRELGHEEARIAQLRVDRIVR